jgi:predicted nucleic acid-binding protein
MNRYLLDTNVVSELRKLKPHGAVTEWLQAVPNEQLYLSAVTRAELQAGVELTREQDREKASALEHWADDLFVSYPVLTMDTSCFREWARLVHRKSHDLDMDAMIAATARIHGLVVATRNERDFRDLQVEVFNPFRFKAGSHSSGA